MGFEHERKFLVLRDRLPELVGGARYIQGYLSDNPEIRFRIEEDHVTLAVKKSVAPGSRVELEFPREGVESHEIDQLNEIALWPPLVKTRYRVPYGRLLWEIDVYEGHNEGLITAEVELPRIDHPMELPPWIDGENEITSDWRFANINLTRRPFQSWDAAMRQKIRS